MKQTTLFYIFVLFFSIEILFDLYKNIKIINTAFGAHD
nr:hypothetical protein [Mucilaginibacter sp. E4BP6]